MAADTESRGAGRAPGRSQAGPHPLGGSPGVPDGRGANMIPSAGPDMKHLLDQDVVIAGDTAKGPTGAQAIEPTHSPRTPHKAGELPSALLAAGAVDLQREVEQLLY